MNCSLLPQAAALPSPERPGSCHFRDWTGVSRKKAQQGKITDVEKKELSFLLCVQLCSPPIPKIPLLRPWNWTSSGRLCSKKHSTLGFGLPCAARRDRWSLMPWVIGACRTCQRLWEAIPQGYRQGHCFPDFLAGHQGGIPEEHS